jgi:hypothetical protein
MVYGMKNTPGLSERAVTDPTALLRYRDGIYAVDLMTAAIGELDFFTWLRDHPGTLGQICEGFGFAERPADVLLSLAMANGLVERDRDVVYHVTEMAQEHACKGSPWSLTPYYGGNGDRPIVADFLTVLRSGKPAGWGGEQGAEDWHDGMKEEDFAESFTALMNARGLYLGSALADRLDLSGRSRLLDIGGGSGIYACCLVNTNPGLEALVLEQAPVDAIAGREIASRSLSGRIGVVTGDMFEQRAWPGDCDVHLFSNVLHDWDMVEIRQLLTNSFSRLSPGGLLVVHEVFLNRTKDGPLPAAEYSAILMHSTQGRCYGVGEMEEMISSAGFVDFTHADTAGDRGMITAVRP